MTDPSTAHERRAVFNLIDEPWLPMRRRSGVIEHVQPWRVTEGIADDPFTAFAWPRPDFNGAAHELLIGLLSTAAAPKDDEEWEKWWLEPPPPDVLRERFAAVAYAFDLDGPGPRFLQDRDAFENGIDAGKKMGIAALLIDAPGQQTLDKNADLFVSRDTVPVLCRGAAAMGLYTLSAYAPRGVATGGKGHRQSLRKAGPLTTLIVATHGDYDVMLWGRLWPNVETKAQIRERSSDAFPGDDVTRIFPWLIDTRTSEKDQQTTPNDVHPLHVYWGMPRRIRLGFEAASSGESCAITDVLDARVVRHFRIKTYGTNYSDGFEHPLTPYRRKNADDPKPLPVPTELGSLGYRHWPIVQWGDKLSDPPRVVRHWFGGERVGSSRSRIVAYGYFGAVGQVWKARAWLEGEMPVLMLADSSSQDWLRQWVEKTVTSTETVTQLLTAELKKVLYDRSSGSNPSRQRKQVVKSALDGTVERFYRETEAAFYGCLDKSIDSITQDPNSDDPTMEVRQRWARVMEKAALRLFDEYAPSDNLENRDMHRYVKARFYLALALCGRGKKGKSLFERDLGIPSPEGSRPRGRKREAA